MVFYLWTTYGISEDSFSSIGEKPFGSLLQGSGLTSLTCMAMTALMLYSYKSQGHGVNFVSPVSTCLALSLATIVFVDDTNLLFLSKQPKGSVESFLSEIQEGLSN